MTNSKIKTTAPSTLLTLTENGTDVILAVDGDVEAILAGSQRAEPQYGELASHRTNSTRKYQVMAAIPYEVCLAVMRSKYELPSEAAAIRIVFEAGLRAMGFGKLVDEVHADNNGGDI